jgi:hypothetical protein
LIASGSVTTVLFDHLVVRNGLDVKRAFARSDQRVTKLIRVRPLAH